MLLKAEIAQPRNQRRAGSSSWWPVDSAGLVNHWVAGRRRLSTPAWEMGEL